MLQRGEHLRVRDDSVLDDFGKTLIELAPRQSFQKIDVVDHKRGMMDRADQVFSVSRISSGLSADRAIDHGEQRCRYLHMRNAALENRRDKSRDISHHSAAKPDHERLSI